MQLRLIAQLSAAPFVWFVWFVVDIQQAFAEPPSSAVPL
jgi:hypothetical protein